MPLHYQSPDTPTPLSPPSPLPPLIIACIAGLLILNTCIRIEILNAKAGTYLPRKDEGKWRTSVVVSERSWRNIEALQTDDPTWKTRPLTASEKRRMQSEIEPNIIANDLRDWVTSWGYGQYILVAITLLASVTLLRRHTSTIHLVIAMTFLISAIICGILMFHRGYLTSLQS